MIKKILLSLVWAMSAWTSQAQIMPQAYRLFTQTGQPANFSDLIAQAAASHVVLFGELHNAPLSHWLEYKLLEALQQQKAGHLQMGMEMLEADNQLILDEYLQRQISPSSYAREARLWDNYENHYDPLVFFCKQNHIPVVATNVPRRYAERVSRLGLDSLETLSVQAKTYMPPLPIPYTPNPDEQQMFAAMTAVKALSGGESKQYIAQAQALKDATMAWHIARSLRPGVTFVHFNGSFHSDRNGGIIPFLEHYKPGLRICTISTVRQEEVDELDEFNHGTAHFIIVIPEDQTIGN